MRKEEKQKSLLKLFLGTSVALLLFSLVFPASAEAAEETIYNSPYVTFSPDGKAWTTNAGDKGNGDGTDMWDKDYLKIVEIRKISQTALEEGHHYYKAKRTGKIPISYWKVTWREGQCIHDGYPPEGESYHDISFGRQSCLANHYSGWTAYCADCGEPITDGLIYMSREAAESISYLQVEDGLDYYYLCPFCSNLEQGYTLQHDCRNISYNRYRVVYDANHTGEDFADNGVLDGFMSPSIHMYNNDTRYEGQEVTPVTRLTRNAYRRTGYRFTGWNTEPDGSGTFYGDGARILNLTTENWDGTEASEQGTVVLYAQWEPAESTLRIDADGGAYAGKAVWEQTMPYGSVYTPEAALVTPPEGYQVSFVTNGGENLAPIRSALRFVEWSMCSEDGPFQGQFLQGSYTYDGPEGTVDTLKACYAPGSVVLPGPERSGYSFGGWYYDQAFTLPAGGAGDSITPAQDVTLYAQWVELALQSADNYAVNGGKGAVDLSWSQPDGKGKTCLVYQSLDLKSWNRINTAEDIDSSRSVEKAFSYTGKGETYTVPYSGIYTLSLSGAQGGSYGSHAGGAGGSVTGRFYLYKGEVLTVTIGGQNGYNGGGSASLYGSGGGMSSLASNRKGTLLIAGGGGGATALYDGYAGGSDAGVGSSAAGLSGASGGGGGYRGGLSGELIYHEHSSSDKQIAVLQGGQVVYVTDTCLHTHTGDGGNGGGCYGKAVQTPYTAACTVSWQHVDTKSYSIGCSAVLSDGSRCNAAWTWYKYDQNHQCGQGRTASTQRYTCVNGHTGYTNGAPGGSYTHNYTAYKTTYEKNCIAAAYEDGWTREKCKYGLSARQVLSAKPSYGGSSYVNTVYALSYSMTAGTRRGNGAASLQAELIGFQDSTGLSGVSAPDLAAPEAVEESTVEKTALGDREVLVSWQEPEDKGTAYYHRAETYLLGSASRLCESNVTKNVLTSGVKGYYYTIDQSPGTAATVSGSYTPDRSLQVQIKEAVQYLHLAAVDVAGNVGGTIHIRLDAAAAAWRVYTGQLQIEEGENVYAAPEEKTWYVRCDGVTPLKLLHSAYLDGPATAGYQLNYTIYQSEIRGQEGTGAENVIYTPPAENPEAEGEIRAEDQTCSVNGKTLLGQYPYSVTRRSNRGRSLESEQGFLLSREAHGLYLDIRPGAGARYEEDGTSRVRYSDPAQDAGNGITIIGDGEGPVISGLDVLEDRAVIDRTAESVRLTVTARDTLSGVAGFYVKVKNQDNYSEQTFYPENGVLELEITEENPLFTGDFTVTGCAFDNVGNVTEAAYEVTEFALETGIERILEPHTPVFKCGESGILYITTYGYADRVEVEFPEELLALNPELNRTFDYGENQVYKQESQLQFMIPLDTPAKESYVITVRAYKDGRQLQGSAELGVTVEGGTVLGEFRTRLR